jgi:V-type H+-transporting ATPase subunit C
MASNSLSSSSHWIVAMPAEAGSQTSAVDRMRTVIVETTGRNLCEVHPFEVPIMKVGTLDQLMLLSDEAARADLFVESVLKKVERQVAESYNAEGAAKIALLAAQGTKAELTKPLEMMMVSEGKVMRVHDWATKFRWDVNAWGDREESLPDVIRRLLAAADKIDSDIRTVSLAYQEKKNALLALERKKSGNLLVAALEDIITPQALASANCEWTPADSEYLESCVLIFPKPQEEVFLEIYTQLDDKSVPLGPEGRRDALRGSPVVPGSAKKISEDKDGYVAYIVLILKKFSDTFRVACKEKRITVREFVYDPAQAGSIGRQIDALQREVTERLAQLKSESRRKYVESVTVWFHVKAVRVFVESVLRFGLPVNFRAVLIKQKRDATNAAAATENATRLLQGVRATWKKVAGSLNHRAVEDVYDLGGKRSKNDDVDVVIPGISDSAAVTANPFVFLDFNLNEDTGAAAKAQSS